MASKRQQMVSLPASSPNVSERRIALKSSFHLIERLAASICLTYHVAISSKMSVNEMQTWPPKMAQYVSSAKTSCLKTPFVSVRAPSRGSSLSSCSLLYTCQRVTELWSSRHTFDFACDHDVQA